MVAEALPLSLRELRRLTGELEELTVLLKAETRPRARWVIMKQINELIRRINREAAQTGEGVSA